MRAKKSVHAVSQKVPRGTTVLQGELGTKEIWRPRGRTVGGRPEQEIQVFKVAPNLFLCFFIPKRVKNH